MRPALILQHGDWGPPALLGEWAEAHGVPYVTHRVDLNHQLPELDGQPFVVSLGSDHSPRHGDVEAVVVEVEFIKRAVDREIPVLGLCYGGQVLAHVLGGTVEEAPAPELGWHMVSSEEPDEIPEGPWLQWHYDRFTLPPGAQQLASSPRAVQAFRQGAHLGLQFHPESTVEIVKEWARLDGARLAELGIADGEALAEAGRAEQERAREDAFRLFDAFWQRASQPERGES
jgi:GMP synthase-like glutamine amidotransferase